MSQIRFDFSPTTPLGEAFADLQPSLKAFLHEGTGHIAALKPAQRSTLAELAVESFESPRDISLDELETRLGLPFQNRSILAAATVLAAVASQRTETPDVVTSALVATGLVDQGFGSEIQSFVSELTGKREEIAEVARKSRLESEVLPVLTTFEVSIDLRVRFEKGEVKGVVPVAIMHLDTDGNGQEMWCQLSRTGVDRLIADLQKVQKQLAGAATWAAS